MFFVLITALHHYSLENLDVYDYTFNVFPHFSSFCLLHFLPAVREINSYSV